MLLKRLQSKSVEVSLQRALVKNDVASIQSYLGKVDLKTFIHNKETLENLYLEVFDTNLAFVRNYLRSEWVNVLPGVCLFVCLSVCPSG